MTYSYNAGVDYSGHSQIIVTQPKVCFRFKGQLFGGTVTPNNTLFGGTVPPNSTLFGGTPDFEKPYLISMKSYFG